MPVARHAARALQLAAAVAAVTLMAGCTPDDEDPIVTRSCTAGAGNGTNGLQLFGTTSYRDLSGAANNSGTMLFDPGEISFNNPNLTSNSRTGTLRATLWAVSGNYSGGSLSGYVVSRYPINFTDGTSWLFNGQSANLLELRRNADTPPRGSYCMVVTLEEFSSTCTTSDGYCIADWMEFGAAANFE